MTIKHFFITKKTENAILELQDNKLVMTKVSKRKPKVYLSTIDMKTGVIHNKSKIFRTVDLVLVNPTTYALQSKETGLFYSSAPLKADKVTASVEVNCSKVQEWEHFNLQKSKNIMISDDILKVLSDL
ncbi:hypothetical protein [Commensalibacter nepenthis]|uniref:Uncharacterized protein n=1 Tax=Commensalibacter nepenthis TaxID=3043872 RepID=A0ABT6Q502_9PROT|nr:hypothetical protein [Commensalibacter sp. TBRC 10068]MDI2111961.1 hypothetical protein [Commensalibacter sp. TBRC 10068]